MAAPLPTGMALAALLLSGCAGGSGGKDRGDSGRDTGSSPDTDPAGDTSTDTGSDTAPDTGSDTGETDTAPDTDTGYAPPLPLSGSVVLSEDTVRDAALTVAVVSVRFGDGPAIGGTIASAPLAEDGTFSVLVPAAPATADLVALHPSYPDLRAALYAVVVFEDADGDAAWAEGETLRGLAMDTWLSYTTGDAAWPEGWRLADLGLAGQYAPNRCLLDSTVPLGWADGYPTFSGLEAGVVVPLRGLPATLSFGGSMDVLPPRATGLVGLPYAGVDAPSDRYPAVFDLPAALGPFGVTLVDAPRADQDYGSDPDWRYTVHLPVLYTDTDGSGGWSPADELDGGSTCLDGDGVYARYTRPVDTYRGYRFLDCYDGTVGWRAARSDDTVGTVYLSSAEAATLTVDAEACRLF